MINIKTAKKAKKVRKLDRRKFIKLNLFLLFFVLVSGCKINKVQNQYDLIIQNLHHSGKVRYQGITDFKKKNGEYENVCSFSESLEITIKEVPCSVCVDLDMCLFSVGYDYIKKIEEYLIQKKSFVGLERLTRTKYDSIVKYHYEKSYQEIINEKK